MSIYEALALLALDRKIKGLVRWHVLEMARVIVAQQAQAA